MDPLQDRYVILARKVSSFLGMWPTQTYKERFFRTCIVSFMLLYSILAQLCQIFTLELDLQSLIMELQMFIPFVCAASVYAIFYLFGCILIFPFIQRILTISTNEVTYSAKRYPMFSCFDYFLGQEQYFYPIIIYQILTTILMVTVGMICYSLFFWSILHVCARLCIIRIKIHQPFQVDHYSDNMQKKPLDLSDWITDIFQHLSRTRKMLTLLNELSERSNLFQMFLAFILLIMDLLCMFEIPYLMEHENTRKDAFIFIFFFIGTISPICINSHVGQRMLDFSMNVYKEACLIPIHNVSLRTQKLLLTALILNAKPCSISIGKLFVWSHEFFSDLIRMSLSYAMVLHSTQDIR